jgi:hypothetical protein
MSGAKPGAALTAGCMAVPKPANASHKTDQVSGEGQVMSKQQDRTQRAIESCEALNIFYIGAPTATHTHIHTYTHTHRVACETTYPGIAESQAGQQS